MLVASCCMLVHLLEKTYWVVNYIASLWGHSRWLNCISVFNAGVQSVAKLKYIEALNLSGLRDLDDAGVEALAAATSLRELNLDRCGQVRCVPDSAHGHKMDLYTVRACLF